MTGGDLIEKQKICTVTLDALQRYAIASGDLNPIHTDEAVARSMGLPGVIAHGMYISSLLHSFGCEWIRKQKHLQFMGSHVRFKNMTLLGDEVWVSGKVISWDDTQTEVEFLASNQRGEITVMARLIFQ